MKLLLRRHGDSHGLDAFRQADLSSQDSPGLLARFSFGGKSVAGRNQGKSSFGESEETRHA